MLCRWMMGRGVLSGVLGGLVIGLLSSVLHAKPGAVTNRQGTTFKGDITEDDKFVYVNSPGGQLKLDKRNVDKVEYEQTIDDQYELRHSKLDPKDLRGRLDLANWANSNQRADLAVKALTEARKIDPLNKDAARALDAAQSQLDLDQASASATRPKTPGVPATEPAPGTAPPAAIPSPIAAATPLERRLLTNDEVNIIRQREMRTEDPKVKVKFDNGVIKKFLATGDRDAAVFNKLSPEGQALEILSNGDASLAKDVHILTDPTPIMEFKTKVYPLIANGCASTACHGGMKAGNLAFFPGDGTQQLYTNFYILQTYSATVDGVKYQLMDRDVPKRSLALQYGLPASIAMPPHPKVQNYRPRFKTETDAPYLVISDWLSHSLLLPQPDYGIKVAAKVPGTQPTGGAMPMTGNATTLPAAPTTPMLPGKPGPATRPAGAEKPSMPVAPAR